MLTFLDKMNDEKAQNLASNGIEGKHYKKVEGGIEPVKDPTLLESEVEGLNQILNFLPESKALTVVQTPVRKKQDQVQKENEKIVLANPAEPLISNVYTQKGPQTRQHHQRGPREVYRRPNRRGRLPGRHRSMEEERGDDYMKEINELYAKSKNK
ncbi:hypothetical protein LJK87_18885 [Paenibacillus sp. P25]|nr:hypothetical protein LJK87_18885 [Paenibacillus sp. P25]